jgi:hypothetical protein
MVIAFDRTARWELSPAPERHSFTSSSDVPLSCNQRAQRTSRHVFTLPGTRQVYSASYGVERSMTREQWTALPQLTPRATVEG